MTATAAKKELAMGMEKVRFILASLGIMALGVIQISPAGQVKPVPPAVQPGAPDDQGDFLPSTAALKRHGTVRFRHGSRILCVVFSPDGKRIAAAGGDDPIRLWDAQTGKEIRQFKETWIQALAFSPDGRTL